jgi:carboxypeptidase family protein/TonB-dependent receptor-like protein
VRWLLLLAGVVIASEAVSAAQQSNTAIIVGTVVDNSQSAVPGATVTLTHLATNTSIDVLTDERGQYRTPPVRIGEYAITVELTGFKTFEQRGVVLNIGDVRKVDAMLSVGDLSETITVAAAPPPLSTNDSTVGTVITNDQISALPLNGRDYLQLASLSAGTGPQTSSGVSIGGQSSSAVAFLLDGQDNNNQQMSVGHSGQKEVVKPSVDAIQEFKVVTNGYSAEYGRSSSGVVSVSLKSGANRVGGSLFEYFRDAALDAPNYFATTKAPYTSHQFGGSIGFPVVRNRTFFFGDSETGRYRKETTTASTLPTAAVRSGVFSTALTDPLTGSSFPGNTIPDARIDPVARRILQFLPLPQTNAAARNFVYNSPSDQDDQSWNARVDHVFSPRHNVYVRLGSQRNDNKPTSALPADAEGNYVTGGSGDITDSKSVVIVHNAVWTPSLVGSLRVGWNRMDWEERVPDQPLRGVGIPGVDGSNPGFSQVAITGYQTLGISNVPNTDNSRNTQISGDLSRTAGAHTFKTGVQAYWLATDFLSSQRSSGTFTFNGQYTGDPFADFLLGYASNASLSKWATLNFRTPYTHFFVQDDWRVTPRLTLNLGVRYELNPPPVDANDAIANFDLDTDPGHPTLVLASSDGNRAARSLQGINNRQFAPRAGFAYTLPGDKTVVRGGAGIFYGNMITVGGMSSLEINPPNHIRISQTTNRTVPSILLSQGFAADALSQSAARDVNLVSWDRSEKQPTSYQWNANVQRELPGRVVVEVGYTFNRLVHNWRSLDANPAPPGPGDINSRRQFRTAVVPTTGDVITLANITRIQKDGWSQYHGFNTKVEKRYAKGLSLLASYTWSRTRGLEGGYQDPNNVDAEIGPTSTDRPHHFVGSGVWELPIGNGRAIGRDWSTVTNALLGGWSISPILTATSGSPLDLTVNGNPSNSSGTDRPDVVGSWQLDHPTADAWFNTAAFVANAPYAFGNAPKNLLRGPGYFTLDVAVRKGFQLSNRVRADLRFESFNVTNAVNLGNPNTQVGNVNFGRISSAGAARHNQVALRLNF